MAEAFTCPITQEIIKDPVSTKYGHLYEKKAIEDWIDKNHKCPMTNNPLEHKDLYANFAVKAAIDQFIKLNDDINNGSIKLNAEESKDNVPEQMASMQKTMFKLKEDFVQSHKVEELEDMAKGVEYEPGQKPKMNKKQMLAM